MFSLNSKDQVELDQQDMEDVEEVEEEETGEDANSKGKWIFFFFITNVRQSLQWYFLTNLIFFTLELG